MCFIFRNKKFKYGLKQKRESFNICKHDLTLLVKQDFIGLFQT